MKRYFALASYASFLALLGTSLHAAPCPFNTAKDCSLQRDILNDVGTNGLKYYAATRYDHRISGEINVYASRQTKPYVDEHNVPGQLRFLARKQNNGSWKSGEIMTRPGLDLPPFNAPTKSNPWTTRDLTHGYLEVVVKMPRCYASADGLCHNDTAPESYHRGLWPAIWLLPTSDATSPTDGEIDIAQAYSKDTNFKTSTAWLHFNGESTQCQNNDCHKNGFALTPSTANTNLWQTFNKWGFEWQLDPTSSKGGYLITGYFNNQKVWGPLSTDTLPADGANALSRGFASGYYLIVNLALGGEFAGPVDPQNVLAKMYVQSVRAYQVNDDTPPPPPPPAGDCQVPTDLHSMYSPDKHQVTIAWLAPTGGEDVSYYQVADWQKRIVWKGASAAERVFQDQALPGSNGTYPYYVSTVCGAHISTMVKYDVVVTFK